MRFRLWDTTPGDRGWDLVEQGQADLSSEDLAREGWTHSVDTPTGSAIYRRGSEAIEIGGAA